MYVVITMTLRKIKTNCIFCIKFYYYTKKYYLLWNRCIIYKYCVWMGID